MFFGKQKFDINQLKVTKLIKYIKELVINTSQVTLEAPLLRPCKGQQIF